MSRSKWKGTYSASKTIKSLSELKKDYQIKAMKRSYEILPKFIGSVFKVHTGKLYSEILITDEMIGHKFGEFVMTRARFSFKKKKLKK